MGKNMVYVSVMCDTPIFEWYMARFVVKVTKTTRDGIGGCAQNISTIPGSLDDQSDHLKRQRIFTSNSYNFCISIVFHKLGMTIYVIHIR